MATQIVNRSIPARGQRGDSGWNHLLAAVRRMLRTYTTRRALLDMTDEQLADIGLPRSGAVAEAARLPWDMASPRYQRRGATSRWSAVTRRLEQARQRHLIVGDHPEAVSWGG